ncbi:MAG: hypothetical protein NWE83_04380, partial [Candidatus Bathyarchaeota archaeon]|nr:hypothetical protein [Candidatus Bathyarchaeota archaeon]
MKILFVNHNNDAKFFSLMEAIRSIGPPYIVAHANQVLPDDELNRFGPTVIFHNLPVLNSYPADTNAICVNFNESNTKRSFSLDNPSSSNYIKDFIELGPRVRQYGAKYTGDVVYNGDPRVFEQSLVHLVNSKEFDFKFFHSAPFNISGYAGSISRQEMRWGYPNFRATILLKNNNIQLMEAIVHDATPVVFDSADHDKFTGDLNKALSGDTSILCDLPDKNDILRSDTNIDRMIWIFKEIGLSKIS